MINGNNINLLLYKMSAIILVVFWYEKSLPIMYFMARICDESKYNCFKYSITIIKLQSYIKMWCF